MKDLKFSSLTELARGLRVNEYTSVELTQLYLERIARLDEKANAYVTVFEESALLQAHAADMQRRSGLPLPRLHGLPIAVKDLCEIDQQITTAGSLAWRTRLSTVTSAVVERLTSAGMILLGKTNMVEFAFGGWGTNPHMGTPRNPWDWNASHRAPGGSSSGSAVAVAAGLAPAAIASDTGGSARIPASFNGLTGLKVTHGLISTYGVVPMSPSLDSMGVLTRTAEDAALLVEALAGFDSRDPGSRHAPSDSGLMALTQVRQMRIAVMTPAQYAASVTADVQTATDHAVEVFRSLGAKIEHTTIPLDFGELMRSNGTIATAEAYKVHAAYIEDSELPFDPWVRKRIVVGKSVDALTYLTAQAHRQAAITTFNAWMQSYDLLLTPTLPFAAPPLDQIDEETALTPFTRAVNYLGTCAISLPAGFTRDGLPIGVQLIAKPWHESLLLAAAKCFQENTEWHQRTPAGLN